MLDRKTPPTYHQLTDIHLQTATRRHLRNGVPLHIIDAGKQEVLRIDVIFRAGSVYEEKKAQAFFTTKMLSEGSTRYSARDVAGIMDGHGAHIDLSPGYESSTLSVYTLNRHLPVLLPLIRSIITEPSFPQKELDTLRDIKKQKLRVNNTKNAVVASKQFRNLLFQDHPYGSYLQEEDLDGITSDDLLTFFQRNFHQNFELMVAGAVDAEVESLLEETFGDIQFQALSTATLPLHQETPPQRKDIPKKDSLQSSIRTGRILFNLHHPDFNRFNVLNTILGGYFGSRLMRSIREEKGYTYGIYSNVVPMRQAGYFLIGTDVIGEFTQQTMDEISLQINNLREVPVGSEELETVKNYMLGSFLSSLNSPFAIADRYKTIYLNELPEDYFDHFIREVNSVSAEELQTLARTWLNPQDFTTVIVGAV